MDSESESVYQENLEYLSSREDLTTEDLDLELEAAGRVFQSKSLFYKISARSTRSAHPYRIPLIYIEAIAKLEAAGYTHYKSSCLP